MIAGKIKDKQRSRIISNLIPLLGMLELPGLLFLVITALIVDAYEVAAIAAIAMILYIMINIITY